MTLQRKRDYELAMILSPEATESEAADTVKRISDIITEGGGSISHQENWGIRRLAYPIQRFIEGNYFIMRCQMAPRAASELDKTLNAAQDVMRHLLFRLEKSEIAAMEAQAERQRQELEKQEAERRAAAARDAREREEAAARIAAEREASQQAEQQTTSEDSEAPAVEGEASQQAEQQPASEAPEAPAAEAESTEEQPPKGGASEETEEVVQNPV